MCTPKLSLYFFIPPGLPATSLICLGCHLNGNAACRLSPSPLVDARWGWEHHFAHWGTSQAATALSASDDSNKLLPAPPKDRACRINLALQLFVPITCHSPSHLLQLHPFMFPLWPGPSPRNLREHRRRQVPTRRPSSEVVGKAGTPVTHW